MFCDEVYSPGHNLKHRKSQVYVMEAEDDCFEENALLSNAEIDDLQQPDQSIEPQISVNALSGATTFNCMRVVGEYGKKKLHILIDPGSTHNFIDLKIANELNCPLVAISPMTVTVANEEKLISNFCCENFQWQMQGFDYTVELRTLPLDCCDIVLGIQWQTTIGPIWWDFVKMNMEFSLDGV